MLWDKDCLFIVGLYSSSHVGLLTPIRPADSDNDNNSLCHLTATPCSRALWHPHHGPDVPAPLVQPSREKKPQRVKIPTPWNFQLRDMGIYFTGVLHPWSRGCCWTVSLMLKLSLLPSRRSLQSLNPHMCVELHTPKEPALEGSTAAMQLGSTEISRTGSTRWRRTLECLWCLPLSLAHHPDQVKMRQRSTHTSALWHCQQSPQLLASGMTRK